MDIKAQEQSCSLTLTRAQTRLDALNATRAAVQQEARGGLAEVEEAIEKLEQQVRTRVCPAGQ
jgi:hypothetical protein